MGLLDNLHAIASTRQPLFPPGVDPLNVVIDEIYSSREDSIGGRSRMANGTYAGHRALEQELALLYGCSSAVVFSTGFVTNLGVLSTLTGSGDVSVLDADSHASILQRRCR